MEEKEKKKKKKRKRGGRANGAESLKDRVLDLFNKNLEEHFSLKQLQKKFNASKIKQKADLQFVVSDLLKAELIKLLPDGTFQTNLQTKFIEGRIDFVSREYAFLITDTVGEADIKIANRNLKQALDGDRVIAKLLKINRQGKQEAEVVEVLQRGRTDYVGKIEVSNRYAFVIPEMRKMFYDIFVRMPDINGAQHGDKVIAEITEWDATGKSPIGRVKKVLGKAGEHETEMHAIMAEFDLPFDFPEHITAEAEAIPETISPEEIGRRRDFRRITTVTIDPVDAKDFDDALSIRTLENGNYEIGVHIADVTHYVKPNTHLEKEAFKRATSVYLVDRVVPMLPEKLSNVICSLRPNEDKLTYSAVFEITPRGKLVTEWIGETVIHSDRRFSYEEAQERLDSGKGDFAEELITLNKLAKIFQKKRFASGAISFESVEVKFKLDEKGKPLELVPKVRTDSHKLIEEFMLLANKRVAQYVFDYKKGKERNPMVYRTHDNPDPDKLQDFSTFAKRFGYNISVEPEELANSLNALAGTLEGRPEQNVLQQIAIRTMAKAKYTTKSDPHFGLAFEHYTHFTSPIRRYPDMMVHRLVKSYLENHISHNFAELEKHCLHSSEREKKAADAERASVKYKQVELMQEWRGRELDGIITGVTEWGIYVEITATRCEGMVRMIDLDDDYYEFDSKNYRLVGRNSHATYTLGDKVCVSVKSTNLEKRLLDLVVV